jgi:cobalt-zinc-cadmium efflux system outer membrane protein
MLGAPTRVESDKEEASNPRPANAAIQQAGVQPTAQPLPAGPVTPATPPPPSIATTLLFQVPAPAPVRQPLVIPPGLPGSQAPPIRWPETKPEKDGMVKQLYPPLSPLAADPRVVPGPEGRPLTLSDLQRMAMGNHPSIKNAAAGVEAARGAVRQAAAYPNPSIFWEADTVGTGSAGYQGGGFDQPIKGANKLRLQKAAATMDLRNAELALRRAETDVMYQVRSNYFAVLVALENIKVSRALAVFTERIYEVQVDLLAKGGFAAPYEPMQLRPLVLQARFNLIQAVNQYQASWKQLAASLGLPGLPPTEVAGRVDMPIPVFQYDDVLARALSQHTDVLTAENSLQKSRYNLELAKVTPFPDFDLHAIFQKDYTSPTPPHLMVYTLAVSFPIPVWDQNQGNIAQAFNQMLQAAEGPHQTRVNLVNTLADAYNRYVTAREQVRISLEQVEDQIRVYRRLYERRGTLPGDVAFNDLVTAEQTLVGYITGYVTALGLQWTAVADVANVLQTDDLFQMFPCEPVAPVPDLEHLLPLPCFHPCGGGPDQGIQGPGGPEMPTVTENKQHLLPLNSGRPNLGFAPATGPELPDGNQPGSTGPTSSLCRR